MKHCFCDGDNNNHHCMITGITLRVHYFSHTNVNIKICMGKPWNFSLPVSKVKFLEMCIICLTNKPHVSKTHLVA